MPIASVAASNECHHFMKSLLQHFTSPTPISSTQQSTKQQQPRLTLKSHKMKSNKPQQQTPTHIIPLGHQQPTTVAYPTISTCRQCLHTFSQLNSLRQKLRSAHAAYTASQCQDERTFAHIPMLTVRSYRPQRRPNAAGSMASSLKLEIKRNEPVNALFMADDKWVYIKTSDERRGFIPAKCCQPFAVAVEALAHANHHYYSKTTNHQDNSNPANELKQVDKASKTSNKIPSPVQETQKRLDERNRRVALEEEEENEEEMDPNDLSLFSVSYLDLSNAIVAAAMKSTKNDEYKTTTTNDCVYDNLNEFKSSSSSSSYSSSSLSADNSSSNQYAYLNEEFEAVLDDVRVERMTTTPFGNKSRKTVVESVSKKRKRIVLSPNTIIKSRTRKTTTTSINPYDTLRRCHRQVAIVTPPKTIYERTSPRVESPQPKQSTDKKLFVRIYKKLRPSEVPAPNKCVDSEYENLDELMSKMATAKSSSSSSSSSSSEHIYCNADFF